ncbi:MAG: sodium:calcium antiporter [Gemmatimonadota bacterium]
MSLIMAWSAFAACLLLILYSGTQLSRYGDLIAIRTGLGGAWIGFVLVAGVTSLPELVSGLSSVVLLDAPDLAIGGALGSCVFNLLIIVVLDFLHRPESIYTRLHQGHVLSGAFGIVLLGLIAGLLAFEQQFPSLGLGRVGIYAPVGFIVYAVAARSVFFYEKRERAAHVLERDEAIARQSPKLAALTARNIYFRYAGNAAAVVVAGIVLPAAADGIARGMGWQATFVGTFLMAFATSVPEMIISVQAVRIGAIEMAIGNLLGSNLFDLLIVSFDDLAWSSGSLLAAASGQHVFTAITAMTMSGIVIVGLTYGQKHEFRRIGWASMTLLLMALLNGLVLFLFR